MGLPSPSCDSRAISTPCNITNSCSSTDRKKKRIEPVYYRKNYGDLASRKSEVNPSATRRHGSCSCAGDSLGLLHPSPTPRPTEPPHHRRAAFRLNLTSLPAAFFFPSPLLSRASIPLSTHLSTKFTSKQVSLALKMALPLRTARHASRLAQVVMLRPTDRKENQPIELS